MCLKMSQKIDPREVLLYLNELGYTNINAEQLKEFITDLKKIIKYEYRRRKYLERNNCTTPNNYLQNSCSDINKHKRVKSPSKFDIFETLHNSPTEAFKGKIVGKHENLQPQIAVHITQAKKKNSDHNHCTHLRKNNEETKSNQTDDKIIETKLSLSSDRSKQNTDNSKIELETESSETKSNIRANSKQSQASTVTTSTKFKKSKTQVLRPTIQIKPSKSDPVALYHQYQKTWKTIKFPGENNHLDLRWAIREKLMDGPMVEVPPKRTNIKKNIF